MARRRQSSKRGALARLGDPRPLGRSRRAHRTLRDRPSAAGAALPGTLGRRPRLAAAGAARSHPDARRVIARGCRRGDRPGARSRQLWPAGERGAGRDPPVPVGRRHGPDGAPDRGSCRRGRPRASTRGVRHGRGRDDAHRAGLHAGRLLLRDHPRRPARGGRTTELSDASADPAQLRRWAAGRYLAQGAEVALLVQRAQDLDSHHGPAVLLGMLDVTGEVDEQVRDDVRSTALAWPHSGVRLAALKQLPAAGGHERTVERLAAEDPAAWSGTGPPPTCARSRRGWPASRTSCSTCDPYAVGARRMGPWAADASPSCG